MLLEKPCGGLTALLQWIKWGIWIDSGSRISPALRSGRFRLFLFLQPSLCWRPGMALTKPLVKGKSCHLIQKFLFQQLLFKASIHILILWLSHFTYRFPPLLLHLTPKQCSQSPLPHVTSHLKHHFWGQNLDTDLAQKCSTRDLISLPMCWRSENQRKHIIPALWHADKMILQKGNERGESYNMHHFNVASPTWCKYNIL